MTNRGTAALARASLLVFLLLSLVGVDGRRADQADRLADSTFWRLFSQFSEPDGYFQSENLLSNERGFPAVIPEVAKRTSGHSAYVGVGPEQNFSYLAALRPRIAFIVDVRRQNAILQLLYKALFELSPTRAEFLSRLFSRPMPKVTSSLTSARDLLEACTRAQGSADLFASNLKAVQSHLVRRHGFALSKEDLEALNHVYSAFFEAGPQLTYSFGGRRGRAFPSYAELMVAADDAGVARSYLATEANYQALRDLQRRNLIVPVVGDFAGPKALRAVGGYLANRGLTVTALYASNVESYLFRNDVWRSFYGNLAALPVDGRSVIVRSLTRGFGGGGFGFPGTGGMDGRIVLDPIGDLLDAFKRGEIAGYADIIARPGVRIE